MNQNTNHPKIHLTSRETYFSECTAGLSEGLASFGYNVTSSEDFPTRNVDIHFVIGVHLFPQLIRRNCRLLAGIQSEQLPLFSHRGGEYRLKRNFARFKSVEGKYDVLYEWNPSLFAAGVGGKRFLPYGCPSREFRHCEKRYDVAFIGNIYNSPRRSNIIDNLCKKFRVFPDCSPGFGPEKEQAINSAKVLLNIHHYDSHGMEAPRIFDYLSHGACVLSEWSPYTYPFSPQVDFEDFKTAEELEEKLRFLLANDSLRHDLAFSGYTKSQNFTYQQIARLLGLDLLHCLQKPRSAIARSVGNTMSSFRILMFNSMDRLAEIRRQVMAKANGGDNID